MTVRGSGTSRRRLRVYVALLMGCLIGIPAVAISAAAPARAAQPDTGVTSYTAASVDDPQGIAWGSDGALWFVNYANNSIGRITTSGAISNYVSTAIYEPVEIAAGADGALWFTNDGGDSIGRITTSGTVSTYTLPTGELPFAIAAGPDGNLWFTDTGGNSIGQITTGGTVTLFTGTGMGVVVHQLRQQLYWTNHDLRRRQQLHRRRNQRPPWHHGGSRRSPLVRQFSDRDER
jgi:streptogramin lyase